MCGPDLVRMLAESSKTLSEARRYSNMNGESWLEKKREKKLSS
jgi:hypothetical protein